MKKSIFSCFLFLLSLSAFGQSEADIAFANSFIDKVLQHDLEGVINHLDKSYRKKQLKFLEGNKVQFVNELFGGISVIENQWANIEFSNILRMEVAEVMEAEDGNLEYIFRVRTESKDLMVSLLLHTGKKLGFEGAHG